MHTLACSAALLMSVTAWLMALDKTCYSGEGHGALIAAALMVSAALVSFIASCCAYM